MRQTQNSYTSTYTSIRDRHKPMHNDMRRPEALRFSTSSRFIIPTVLMSVICIVLKTDQHLKMMRMWRSHLPFAARDSVHALPFESISPGQVALRYGDSDRKYGKKLDKLLKILVTDYTAWHRRQRQLCEANPSHAHSLPLLVFRGGKINHGIGDQFRGMLYTYLAAVVTRRLFLIDLQQPFPLSRLLTNPKWNNFTYDASIFVGNVSEEIDMPGERGFPDLSMYFNPARVLIETSQPSFWIYRFYDIPKHYPQLEYSTRIKEANLMRFKPVQSVLAPFLLQALLSSSPSFRESLRRRNPFKGEAYLASHARFGIGLGERQSRFNLEDKGLTLRTASICFGRMVGMAAKDSSLQNIFFATDTQNATEWVEEGIRDVLANATVASLDGRAVHLAHMSNGRQKKDYGAFENSYVDVGLLAGGEKLVALRSGFARLAGWKGAFVDSDTVQVHWGLCPLVKIGTRNVSTKCGHEGDQIKMVSLIDERMLRSWRDCES
eukprot:TRINITY_DN1149_c0_g1_i1.p1 TRINITY_DN1149_c0_g1~~TRINITY_DN1149_c0_g1_i1.p1  ORF type:complete len:493 (-),score=40.91 TRINITY_DN1149_c0_g1_i1:33-1511(-)